MYRDTLNILSIDINTVPDKINLDITDIKYQLNLDDTYVDDITFGDLTLTREMRWDLETRLLDVLNGQLDERYETDSHALFEIEMILDEFVDNGRNRALREVQTYAEELLKQEMEKGAKEFLLGSLRLIDDIDDDELEESLINYFHKQKDGSYKLELNLFFRTDLNCLLAKYSSERVTEDICYHIGEAVIMFEYDFNE